MLKMMGKDWQQHSAPDTEDYCISHELTDFNLLPHCLLFK